MNNLSLRKLAAKTLGLSGLISAKNDLYSIGGLPTGTSLRAKLQPLNCALIFAPKVYLHPDDEYRPSSVDFYLNRVRLMFLQLEWQMSPTSKETTYLAHRRIVQNKPLNSQTLLNHTKNTRIIIKVEEGGKVVETGDTHYSGQGGDETKFYLDVPSLEDSTKRGESSKFTNGRTTTNVPCYLHINTFQKYWDMQYMFFYPFNPNISLGFGDHLGEWEHVTVRVHRTSYQILGIYFSAHNTGGWSTQKVDYDLDPDRDEEKFQVDDHGQPVVFSAIGSHASYPSSGEQKRGWGFEIPNDHTSTGGPIWDCSGQLVFVGETSAPNKNQEWIKFTGRWGDDLGTGVFGGFGESPFGPAFQDSWWRRKEENGPRS